MGFGAWGLYDTLPSHIWSPGVIAASILLLATATVLVHRLSAQRGSQTLQETAVCEGLDVLEVEKGFGAKYRGIDLPPANWSSFVEVFWRNRATDGRRV